LSHYLSQLYPGVRFEVVDINPRGADHLIYLGCAKSFPLLTDSAGGEDFTGPEGYKVTTARIDSRNVGIIFGNDPRGVMYGVYNLLEKLGCGFYLSSDTLPAKGQNSFSFAGWELSDVPLVQDRIVFNWHNFLSGCSTWNLSDWKGWITQAQKMGYNGVMVGFSFAPIVSNSKNRAQSMSPSNRSRVTPFCAAQFSNQLTVACKTENNSNCGT